MAFSPDFDLPLVSSPARRQPSLNSGLLTRPVNAANLLD
jgi:hypothetical protein